MTDGPSMPEPDIDDDPDDLMARRRRRPMWVKVGAVIMLFAAFALAVAIVARGDDGESASSVPHGGDLGSLDDPMALSERLAPELERQGSGPDVGTPPAEPVACGDSQAALPADGAELVYSANLEWEDTPAVVLGYRLEGDGLSRVLLVLAEDDCRLLVTQSF